MTSENNVELRKLLLFTGPKFLSPFCKIKLKHYGSRKIESKLLAHLFYFECQSIRSSF